MIEVAIFGNDALMKDHLNVWSTMSNVELVGKNKKLSWKDIAELEVDVIDLCATIDQRADFIVQASNMGKHIISEMPIVPSIEKTKEIIETCKKNKTEVYVRNSLQFHPAYAHAKKQLTLGNLGQIGIIRITNSMPKQEGCTNLFTQVGGPIFEWLIWAIGHVERVHTKLIQKKRQDESLLEVAFITLRMKNKSIVHLELSWSIQHAELQFEITGNNGMLVYDSKESNPIHVNFAANNINTETPFDIITLQRELRGVREALQSRQSSHHSLDLVLEAMIVAEAAEQSAKHHKPITLAGGAF